MATYVTLTVPVEDILGVDYDERRTAVYIEANTPNSVIIVDADEIRIGGRRENPVSGVATFANLVATNSADNPASFEYRVTIVYTPKGSRTGQQTLTTSTFPLTASANLAAIPEAWDDITAPPSWRSTFRDEMEAIRDGAVAITGPTDATVEALVKNTGGVGPLTSAALAAKFATAVNAAAPPYGLSTAGTGAANLTALNAAIAAVPAAGGTVIIPAGTYPITGNLTINRDNITLRGTGDATFLDFAGGGVIIDGSSGGFTTDIGLYDLSLRRTGTAGPALRFKGGGSGTGVAHFNAANIRVRSSTGEGLLIDGSYIGTFTACYFMACSTYGIKTAVDSVGGTVFANNVTFLGGETQGCVNGIYLDTTVGFTFVGHAIEGNTTSGIELARATRGVLFSGCYFEANGTAGGGWDIKIGTSTTEPRGTVIQGCYFGDGASAKDRSIILVRSLGTVIQGNDFNAYTLEPVVVQEAVAGAVTGVVLANVSDSPGGRIVDYGTSTLFGKELDATAVLDYPSIAANSEADLTITVTGAQTGDKVTAHPNGLLEAGCTFYAVVTAANTVTVRVRNHTGSAIDPPARTWRVRVRR